MATKIDFTCSGWNLNSCSLSWPLSGWMRRPCFGWDFLPFDLGEGRNFKQVAEKTYCLLVKVCLQLSIYVTKYMLELLCRASEFCCRLKSHLNAHTFRFHFDPNSDKEFYSTKTVFTVATIHPSADFEAQADDTPDQTDAQTYTLCFFWSKNLRFYKVPLFFGFDLQMSFEMANFEVGPKSWRSLCCPSSLRSVGFDLLGT